MAKQAKEPHPNQPVQTLRHRSLKATIWRNETEKGPMYNVTVVRSYKENDQWHDTHSFGFDDLMNLAKLLFDANSWISSAKAKDVANGSVGRRSSAQ